MCDNPNLSLNFFESRNTVVITTLLDVDNQIDNLSYTDYVWVDGRSMRAHGGFVKKISGTDTDDDFKAYILPSVSKIDFIRTNVINTNSNEEVAVTGSQDKLKFKLENKIVVYELCKGSIVDVDNETPDNDKMIETSREISAIMSNENEENKEETVVPEVTTTKEVEEQVVTPAEEEPVSVPEEEEPVAVPAEEEQEVTPAEEEPVEEPVEEPAEEEQVSVPAEEEPEEEQVEEQVEEEQVVVPEEEPVAVPVEAKGNTPKMSFVDNALKSINDKLTSFSTNILSKKTETPEIISITPGSTVLPKPQEVDINTVVKNEIEQIGEATEEQEPTQETESPVTTQEPTKETESLPTSTETESLPTSTETEVSTQETESLPTSTETEVSTQETDATTVSTEEVNKPSKEYTMPMNAANNNTTKTPNSSGSSGSSGALLVGGKSRKRRLIRGSNSRKVKTI